MTANAAAVKNSFLFARSSISFTSASFEKPDPRGAADGHFAGR